MNIKLISSRSFLLNDKICKPSHLTGFLFFVGSPFRAVSQREGNGRAVTICSILFLMLSHEVSITR